MAVKIVTDSISDLPQRLAEQYGVEVVPINIHFGDEIYKDGIEIWNEEFYYRLQNDPVFPSTSAPAPGDFLETYQRIATSEDVIISIHAAASLSGTINSAHVAAGMLKDKLQITIIDSSSVSMGYGAMVLMAAELAKHGASPKNIIERVHQSIREVVVYFTLTDLGFLQRNGRIGKATSLLGSLLNIKPILTLSDGVITPVDKVRGNFRKVAEQMVDKIQEQFGDKPLLISVAHTEMPDAAQMLQKIAESRLHITRCYPVHIGPTVATHGGPTVVGIIALPDIQSE